MNRKVWQFAALALLAAASATLSAGCKPAASKGVTDRKIRVTATVGMVADVVKNVGGDRVEVTALMPPGTDPHLYKASEGDLGRLANADVIFYGGLNLEGKMADVFVKMARSKPTIAVSDSAPKDQLREPPEFQGHYDPHIWFDVSLWAHTIQPVVEGLSELDPANRPKFEQNAAAFRAQLDELHAYCKAQLATIPKPQRVLVTAHDAFGYFGRAYDVEVVGLQGISTVSEADLGRIQQVVERIAKSKIKAVFVETSVSDRSLKAVVEGCRARGHEVKVGGTLFSDAMGPGGTPEGTYVGMVRHNVDTIVEALK